MSAPLVIDYLMDAILMQSTLRDNKQAVERNGSEPVDENREMVAVSSENLSDGKRKRKRKKRTKMVEEKETVVDEIQSIDPLTMEEGSTENLAEGNATEKRNKKRKRKKAKVKDEVQMLGQNNMDTGSTKDLGKGIVTIEKPRFKDDVQSIGVTRMGERSTENLAEGNVTIEKPKSKYEGGTVDQTRMAAGSTEDLLEGNATLKNPEIQEEVQSMDESRMDMGSTEFFSDTNVTGKRKKKHKRKTKIKDDVLGEIDTRSGEMDVRSTENLVEGDVTFEKPKTKDDVKTIGQFKNDSRSAENSAEGNLNVEKPRMKDEVQNLDQIKMVSESTAEGNVTVRDAKTQEEAQSIDQTNMDTRPLGNLADGQGTNNKANSKDEVHREKDTRSTEDLAEENAIVVKPQIGDEILGVGHTKMDTGSSENLTEGNLTLKDKKVQEEVESVDQTKMDTGGLTENSAEANETGKRKKKRRSKVKINDEVQSNTDTRSTENPAQGNASLEKPKIKDEVQSFGQCKLGTGSAGNLTIKDQKVLDEVQSMAQTKIDTGPTENSAEGNVTGKIEKKRKSKAKDNNEVHSNIDTRSTEDLAQGNAIIEMPKIKDDVHSIGQSKIDTGSIENIALGGNATTKNLRDEVQDINHSKMDTRPTGNFAVVAVTGKRKKKRKSKVKLENEVQRERNTSLTENLALGNVTIERLQIEDEVHSIDQTKMDTKPAGNIAERNVSIRNLRVQDEAQSMDQIKMDMGPSEKSSDPNVIGKRKKKRKSKVKIKDEIQRETDTTLKENLGQENVIIEKPKFKDDVQTVQTTMSPGLIENLAERNASFTNPKIQDEAQEIDKIKMDMWASEGGSAEGNVTRKRKKKRKSKSKINEGQRELDARSTENLAQGNVIIKKSENGLSEVCNEIILDKGKDYAEGTGAISTDVYPQIVPTTTIRKKLLVLDVNGLLADIIQQPAHQSSGGIRIYGRTVHKRPFCDDFLRFCFQNFDVGIWSSRKKRIMNRIVSYLLGNQIDKLLFSWDVRYCTKTGTRTLENKCKPLVCKELKKIWENGDPNLPWKKGDYDESNTLLLDDSPYKALLNPLHTAIFPDSYDFANKNDDSLGPCGALRVYLKGLLTAENVQKYVEEHPFGQRPITKESSSWEFYSKVIKKVELRSTTD